MVSSSDALLNTKLSLMSQDVSVASSAAASGNFMSGSNLNMHSQLVNAAYQSYTSNFGLPPHGHHYTNHHGHHQPSVSLYPPTPPKDVNNNSLFMSRAAVASGSLLAISHTSTDNNNSNSHVKSESLSVSPTGGADTTASSGGSHSLKKIKRESTSSKRKTHSLKNEDPSGEHNNASDNDEYEEADEEEDEEGEEEEEDDEYEEANAENSFESSSVSPSDRHGGFVSGGGHAQEWMPGGKNLSAESGISSSSNSGGGDKLSAQEKWTHNASNKMSNSAFNSKKKTLPGNYCTHCRDFFEQ